MHMTDRRNEGKNDVDQCLEHDHGTTGEEGVGLAQIQVQRPEREPQVLEGNRLVVPVKGSTFTANHCRSRSENHRCDAEACPVQRSRLGEIGEFLLIGGIGRRRDTLGE